MVSPDLNASALSLLALDRRAVHVAASTDRLTDAVNAELDVDAWQRAEIEAALQEVEAGDFATEDAVEAAFRPRTEAPR